MLHKSVCVTSRTINYVYYDVIFMEKLQNYIREQGIKKKRKKEKQKQQKCCKKLQSLEFCTFFYGHGVKVRSGLRDRGPRNPSKFKSGTPGTPSKFESRTPGPSIKFKSGTFIMTFLHCYIYNMEMIFHE